MLRGPCSVTRSPPNPFAKLMFPFFPLRSPQNFMPRKILQIRFPLRRYPGMHVVPTGARIESCIYTPIPAGSATACMLPQPNPSFIGELGLGRSNREKYILAPPRIPPSWPMGDPCTGLGRNCRCSNSDMGDCTGQVGQASLDLSGYEQRAKQSTSLQPSSPGLRRCTHLGPNALSRSCPGLFSW